MRICHHIKPIGIISAILFLGLLALHVDVGAETAIPLTFPGAEYTDANGIN